MSSMRNAVQRRNHRERAQPVERQKLGLLEKHKDYSLRARDHNEKKARLRSMRQKAADRNPDEFSFGMVNSKIAKTGGKLADRGNKSLTVDVVRLLKTQDAGYIRTALASTRKERERVEQSFYVHREQDGGAEKAETFLQSAKSGRRHKAFVEDEEEQLNFSPESWFGTDAAGLAKEYNRPRAHNSTSNQTSEHTATSSPKVPKVSKAEQPDDQEEDQSEERRRDFESRRRYLEVLKARETALVRAEQELDLQRARLNRNIGGVNKNGVKFKIRQRKR